MTRSNNISNINDNLRSTTQRQRRSRGRNERDGDYDAASATTLQHNPNTTTATVTPPVNVSDNITGGSDDDVPFIVSVAPLCALQAVSILARLVCGVQLPRLIFYLLWSTGLLRTLFTLPDARTATEYIIAFLLRTSFVLGCARFLLPTRGWVLPWLASA
jgi:hypothetical protein